MRGLLRWNPRVAATGSGWADISSTLPPVPTIVLNGEARPIQTGQTVIELLRELGLDSRQVAVERNREVVPRADHGVAVLGDGDQLEIVTFVGGG